MIMQNYGMLQLYLSYISNRMYMYYVGVIHISRKHVMMYVIYTYTYSILYCAFSLEKT